MSYIKNKNRNRKKFKNKNKNKNKIVKSKYPTKLEDAKEYNYNFWDKQTITKIGENPAISNIIDKDINEKFKNKEQSVCKSYRWYEFNLNNSNDINDVVNFLNKYYKQTINNNFIVNYSKEFLEWNLPKESSFVIGLKAEDNENIGAIIAGTIRKLQIFDKQEDVADINYLCVHPKLRENNLSPVLIDEVIRKLSNQNIKVGFFKTTNYIPSPICKLEYYHRPLRYKKLYENGFIRLDKDAHSTESADYSFQVQYKQNPRHIKMTEKHYEKAFELLNEYHDQYNLHEVYTLEKFIKTFANSDIVSSYVILDENEDVVIDFYSYYKLPYYSQEKKIYIRCAYLHTYTSNTETPITIFKSLIWNTYNEKLDVLTCLDNMENSEILYDNFNKIVKGAGYIYYNFYNWNCPELQPLQIMI
jgi:glycylpeptide N-tetradecanoyltransferase